MKKTLINILIIFVISTLNSIEKNEHIELPKIPIYIEGNYSTLNNQFYKKISSPQKAIYNFQLVPKKSYKGARLGTRIFTTLLGTAIGGLTGYLIMDNNENGDKDISAIPSASILGAYVIGGAVAFGFAPEWNE